MSTLLETPPSRSAVSPIGGAAVRVICHCLGLSEDEVKECISLLAHPTVEAIGEMSGAGTGCTGCRIRIQRVIDGKPAACGRFGPCEACGNCRAVCGCDTEHPTSPSPCHSHCQPAAVR